MKFWQCWDASHIPLAKPLYIVHNLGSERVGWGPNLMLLSLHYVPPCSFLHSENPLSILFLESSWSQFSHSVITNLHISADNQMVLWSLPPKYSVSCLLSASTGMTLLPSTISYCLGYHDSFLTNLLPCFQTHLLYSNSILQSKLFKEQMGSSHSCCWNIHYLFLIP